jgi:hypothetical protein
MENMPDLKVFNPNKEISIEITLEILIRHRDALKQARTGELKGVSIDKLSDNERKLNQVKALSLIISAQREMITASRPIIYFRSTKKWERQNRDIEEDKKVSFEKDENDYNKMLEWLDFLKRCEEDLLKAEKTRRLDDDFLVKKSTAEGEVYELTTNFREMLEDLEHSYEQIYLLMLINKIVSAGIEEDEYQTHQELAEEARKRIIDS